MIEIKAFTDDNEFQTVAKFADGEFIEGEETFGDLPDREKTEERLMERFDGPYTVAVKHDEDPEEPAEKSPERPFDEDWQDKEDPCWDGYEMVGTKVQDGETVPDCVPKSKATKARFANKLAESVSEDDGSE